MRDRERKNVERAFRGALRLVNCEVNLCGESEDTSSEFSRQPCVVVFEDGKKLPLVNLQDMSDFLADCGEVRKHPENPRVLIARCPFVYYEGAE